MGREDSCQIQAACQVCLIKRLLAIAVYIGLSLSLPSRAGCLTACRLREETGAPVKGAAAPHMLCMHVGGKLCMLGMLCCSTLAVRLTNCVGVQTNASNVCTASLELCDKTYGVCWPEERVTCWTACRACARSVLPVFLNHPTATRKGLHLVKDVIKCSLGC